MKYTLKTIIFFVFIAVVILAGCSRFKLSNPSSSSPSIASEPLTGTWVMTRTGIEPPLPSQIPAIVQDQVFPKSPTWAIASSTGQLTIKYNGKPIWFNSLGINVTAKTVSAAEAADKKSCTFTGGGSMSESKLPGVLAVAGAAMGNPQNIMVTYTDRVEVTMTSLNQINATITYNASGSYDGNKGKGSFSNSAKLSYTGTRK